MPDLTVFAKRTPGMQHDTLRTQDMPLTTSGILSPRQDLEQLLGKARAYLVAGAKVVPGISTGAMFTGLVTYRSLAHGSTEVVRDEALDSEIPLTDMFN